MARSINHQPSEKNMKTRKHYIDYFDSLITKHRNYQIGHRAVINNILRDFFRLYWMGKPYL